MQLPLLKEFFSSGSTTQSTLEDGHSDLLSQGTAGGILVPFSTVSFQLRIMTGLCHSTQKQQNCLQVSEQEGLVLSGLPPNSDNKADSCGSLDILTFV